MHGFLVDEDLPFSLAQALRAAGVDAIHVSEAGLRSRPDGDVLEYAVKDGGAVITCDIEFGSVPKYPLGSHCGVVVCRFRGRVAVEAMKARVVEALSDLGPEDIDGSVVVVEPQSVRIRKKRE